MVVYWYQTFYIEWRSAEGIHTNQAQPKKIHKQKKQHLYIHISQCPRSDDRALYKCQVPSCIRYTHEPIIITLE